MKARGGTGAVRDGRGEFDAERNREAAIGARSAPPSAADSSAGSHSSATGSIPAGGGVCGRGRARKEKVRTWGAEARRGPEHMTRAGACPAAGGRQRARSAPKHNAPRRGGCFAKGVCASRAAPVRSWTEDEGWSSAPCAWNCRCERFCDYEDFERSPLLAGRASELV